MVIRPLTTEPRVWKTLGVIFAGLCVLTFLFFYFRLISLPVVLGLVMIIITERLLAVYHEKTSPHLQSWQQIIHWAEIFLAWMIVTYVLLHYSVEQIQSISSDIMNPDNPYAQAFLSKLSDFEQAQETGASDEWPLMFSFLDIIGSKTEHFLEDINHFLFNCVFIIPILFAYHFFKSDKIKSHAFELVPPEHRTAWEKGYKTISHELKQHFLEKIRLANTTVMFSFLIFYILGLKGAFLVALCIGILSTIPHIGMLMGLLLSVFIARVQEPLNAGGDFFLGMELDNTMRPLLITIALILVFIFQHWKLRKHFSSRRVEVDHLLEIILVLAAAQIIGIMGMFFAVPIYIVFKVVLTEFYEVLVSEHRPR